MTAPLVDYCDECGAANPPSASLCFACHSQLIHPVVMSATITPIRAQQTIQTFVTPAAPAVVPGPGVLLRGRYELIREIGQGGFGVVYLARNKRTSQKVAVKQINIGQLNAREIIDATDSYNREVTILQGLKHSHLPLFYDHFTDPEHWYLVTEYIAGQTLEEYQQTLPGGTLPIEQVLKIGVQLCKILEYLHSQKPPIIFRDVKPANIMYTPRGKVYLIDFGIARRFRANSARDTGPLGSPGYAAPEQYGTAQTTMQTDIYGLGATLQALLTGTDPSDAPAPIPSSLPRLRLKLQRLLEQMLEKESSKRPSTARQVRVAFEDLLSGRWTTRSFLWGFFWGVGPYLPVMFMILIPALGFSCIPLAYVYACLWPFMLGAQLILALVWLCQARRRLMGLGLLVGLAFLVLGMIFHFPGFPPTIGWPPSMGE